MTKNTFPDLSSSRLSGVLEGGRCCAVFIKVTAIYFLMSHSRIENTHGNFHIQASSPPRRSLRPGLSIGVIAGGLPAAIGRAMKLLVENANGSWPFLPDNHTSGQTAA